MGGYFSSDLFPRVFTGPEPRPVEPVNPPSSEELRQALEATDGAVVRIESLACGGLVTGTGFLASSNLVITNAHVIAGSSQPTVVDTNGQYRATPVIFDPELDIAILQVEGVEADPLELSDSTVPRGTVGATIGYPGGGSLEITAAAVLRQINAMGRNIYGTDLAMRQVYELQTTVETGNSGGPVVSTDGTVLGVIFAKSESSSGIGYAVTAPEVAPLLAQAEDSPQSVSTQQCVR